jgi:hypothetical protein
MRHRIKQHFAFQAAVYVEETFLMNIYEITLEMHVVTGDSKEQNIAMSRINYMIEDCFQNCVFVHQTETAVIEKYMAANLKVSTTPDEPYDQLLAILLLTKLNIITEGRLLITDITLSSGLSDGVEFLYSPALEHTPLTTGIFNWWNELNTKIVDFPKRETKKEKIVKLVKKTMIMNIVQNKLIILLLLTNFRDAAIWLQFL